MYDRWYAPYSFAFYCQLDKEVDSMGKKFEGVLCQSCNSLVKKQIFVTGSIHLAQLCKNCRKNLLVLLHLD